MRSLIGSGRQPVLGDSTAAICFTSGIAFLTCRTPVSQGFLSRTSMPDQVVIAPTKAAKRPRWEGTPARPRSVRAAEIDRRHGGLLFPEPLPPGNIDGSNNR
jgi:hypothetical protein